MVLEHCGVPQLAVADDPRIAQDAEDECGESSGEEEKADEDEDDQDGDEQCKLEPAEIHTTTSRHDDWLHRGPLLADLPWLVYMMRVRRVRKPTQADADYSQLFFFDEHYPMSVLYCQKTVSYTHLTLPTKA